MSKNDGGSAMTIDLESLRAALNVMDEAVCEAYRAMPTPFKLRGESTRHLDQHIAYMSELREAWRTVDAALTELTARRARDAEVEALVAALREAMEWNWLDEDASPSKVADQCEKALATFAGDKT